MAVPFETRDALVPSMLLQPLVENAVRYGVAPLIEGGWIAIKSALNATGCELSSGTLDGMVRASRKEWKWNRSGKYGGAPENTLWGEF